MENEKITTEMLSQNPEWDFLNPDLEFKIWVNFYELYIINYGI